MTQRESEREGDVGRRAVGRELRPERGWVTGALEPAWSVESFGVFRASQRAVEEGCDAMKGPVGRRSFEAPLLS